MTLGLVITLLITLVGAPGAGAPAASAAPGGSRPTPALPIVRVAGRHLVNGRGQVVRLLGVDRSGAEYACSEGWGIFDGPTTMASIRAMLRWHVNAVRLPLNEACWLGLPGITPAYAGAPYRQAIGAYVRRLRTAGLIVIVDLAGLAVPQPSTERVWPMADAQYSPAFWASVARYFRHDRGMLFDLYNEPHDISWYCWLHGGCPAPLPAPDDWVTAGMQQLVNAVRSTGATQPLLLGGLNYAGNLAGWRAHMPRDPDHQLVASFHTYNTTYCNTGRCWQRTVAPLAARVPVVTGEMGQYDCEDWYITRYMRWADAHGISYLGWAWDAGGTWTCTSGPTLITSYAGTPTRYGAGLRGHLTALARR